MRKIGAYDWAVWGLAPALGDDGKPKQVWLPRGVVIPWSLTAPCGG